ncbi:Fes1-domain-containing protein, partial [Meira miltonrushii]
NPDQLLKWSIAQSTPGGGSGDAEADAANHPGIQQIAGDISSGRRPDLADPALYDALMGKSEAQMMREELSAALDTNRTESDRIQALDNFEMLIEQIDNANNITSMKMWEPLLGLLTGSQESHATSPAIQVATLWIVGTAVQNNDKAQMTVLQFGFLKPIISLLVHGADGQVRSKALYALSGILKHNAKAVLSFIELDGWNALCGALLDPDVSLRRKSAFLINSLLLQDDSASQSTQEEVPPARTGLSTAVAPVPNSGPGELPSAPLEQPPATLADGIKHPSIVSQLVESRLLNTLIVSLLPASIQSSLPSASLEGIDTATSAGPDGDIELRDDLDYAEKASRACLTFVEKCQEAKENGKDALQTIQQDQKQLVKTLLHALLQEWNEGAIEQDADIKQRWQELGL